MTRARRQIQEKLKWIDVAIELLDARLPIASRNPMIDHILRNKPRLMLMNKCDMADAELTIQWVEYFQHQGYTVLPIDAATGKNVEKIPHVARKLLQKKFQAQRAKGMKPQPVRALIVGIPNVGKSTLINKLAGRAVTATGDRPGVTKGQQWIRVGTEMELLDTPGILWPKFEDQAIGYRLAATGAIRTEILNVEDIVLYTLKHVASQYWKRICKRYNLEIKPINVDNINERVQLLEWIGRKRGCLIKGGNVDVEKTAHLFLRELQTGKLGKLTLEVPPALEVI